MRADGGRAVLDESLRNVSIPHPIPNHHPHLHHGGGGYDGEEVPADYVVGEVVEEKGGGEEDGGQAADAGGAEAVGQETFVDCAEDGELHFLSSSWQISSVA